MKEQWSIIGQTKPLVNFSNRDVIDGVSLDLFWTLSYHVT